jgi:purine-binding chemotaxis protein CheW
MMGGTNRLLIFSLQGSKYALDLRDVAEVLDPPLIFPIPRAPLFLPGIMNFHGILVSVLDLARFLNKAPRDPHGKVFVVDSRIANLAVWVDMVESIVDTDVVLEEDECTEPLVVKVLTMAAGEVKMLSVEKLLERLEEALSANA